MSTDPQRLFSEWTKMWTDILSEQECWVCDRSHKDSLVIHPVIEPDDSQTKLWEEAGLFTFSYESTANTILLCLHCQYVWDSWSDPYHMFFPADLKFFIEFEMKDREKRRILAEAGYVTKRQVPTAAEYLKHQEENGLVSSNASGGLYKRVFLIKNFTPVLYQIPKVMREWSTPKQWHGDPMVSIRRAIAALGSPRFLLVDPTIRRDLERLRDLYFSDWSQIPGNDCLRGLNARDNKRYLEEQGSSNHPAKKVKEQKTEPDVGVANRTSPTDSSQTDTNWVFGPDSTANNAVQSYATRRSQD